MKFFVEDDTLSGPNLTEEMVQAAEAILGVRLPDTYVEILRERNGGTPARRCFRTSVRTSWAKDHVEITALLGLGFDEGVDGKLGSAYLVQEWGYPNIGVVICDTPSAGHDTVMLDYRDCGPQGEPKVVYIDDDRTIVPIATTFAELIAGLIACDELRSAETADG